MSSRRHFLKTSTVSGIGALWAQRLTTISRDVHLADNKIDWNAVRDLFPITNWDQIHFNSGSAGVMPIPVEDQFIALTKVMNRMAPYEAWGQWQDAHKVIMSRLGSLVSCSAEDLMLVRNTTEGLNMISTGLQLEKGDEIILAKHDYPYAENTWSNRSTRNELIIKRPNIQLPASEDEIINAYKKCISSKTRVMHITHITHREGHILPVKKLVALARKNGIIAVIDGAHVVGQIPLDIQDINPHFYTSSLHKWLNVPHGNGLLYVNPEATSRLIGYPSSNKSDLDNIKQFSHLGTRSFQLEIGIGAALDFHDMIGAQQKYERLQYLKHYWTSQLKNHPAITWYSNLSDTTSCSVVTIGLDGQSAGQVKSRLKREYNIHSKSVGIGKKGGVRISPNIFTNEEELDQLVQALKIIGQ